jgi:ATP-dependent DNA ligase
MELGSNAPLCLWCFDLLYVNGVRFMPMPIEQRKAILADVVRQADSQHIQFSGDFDDPMKLEGIVSKRRESPYQSGPTRDWPKVKTAIWRAANVKRFERLKKRA